MKHFLLSSFIVLLFIRESQAQFSQSFAPSKWTATNSAGATGSVNTDGAPNSIVITGSNGALSIDIAADFSYTNTARGAGPWSFSWSYHTNDTGGPEWDLGGVLIGGVFTPLTSGTSGNDQSGTYTGASVTVGTVIGFLVRAIDDFGGNSTFTITNFSPPAGILPVKLISFNAAQSGAEVKINWLTGSEMNSDRFEVERSSNGNDFTLLTSIKANGTGAMTQSYTVYDKAPLSGTNYYRLKEIDIDGTYTYSFVFALDKSIASKLQLFPNPVKDKVTIKLNALQYGTIRLYTISGRLLESRNISLRTTGNTIEWNTGALQSGHYFFKIGDSVIPFIKD